MATIILQYLREVYIATSPEICLSRCSLPMWRVAAIIMLCIHITYGLAILDFTTFRL